MPLYGRRTATIDLTPLEVADARQFSPDYVPETAITALSLYGGTPYYLQTIDRDQPLGANAKTRFCRSAGSCTQNPNSSSVPNSGSRARSSVTPSNTSLTRAMTFNCSSYLTQSLLMTSSPA